LFSYASATFHRPQPTPKKKGERKTKHEKEKTKGKARCDGLKGKLPPGVALSKIFDESAPKYALCIVVPSIREPEEELKKKGNRQITLAYIREPEEEELQKEKGKKEKAPYWQPRNNLEPVRLL